MILFRHSMMFSLIHFKTAGSAYRLSTGISKKPWICDACKSIVIIWSAPATESILATSLAEMGARLCQTEIQDTHYITWQHSKVHLQRYSQNKPNMLSYPDWPSLQENNTIGICKNDFSVWNENFKTFQGSIQEQEFPVVNKLLAVIIIIFQNDVRCTIYLFWCQIIFERDIFTNHCI